MVNPNYRHDVFICYAYEDRTALAVPLALALKKLKLSVWLDKDSIYAGDAHIPKIREALKESMFIVAIMSPTTQEKTFPKMEIGGVLFNPFEKRERLIPVCFNIPIDDVSRGLKYFGTIQNLEISSADPNFEENLVVLANEINKKVQITKTQLKGEREKQENQGQRTNRILIALLALVCGLVAIYFLFFREIFKTDPTPLSNNEKPIIPHDSVKNFTMLTPVSPIKKTAQFPEPKREKSNKTEASNQKQTVEKEDYSLYVNAKEKVDISVLILDENDKIENSISNDIAKIYSKSGKTGNIGLLKSTFIAKSEFRDLSEGNSDIIGNLELNKYTNYLLIGKIIYSSRQGNQTSGTIVCNVSIDMKVINVATKSINSFNVFGIGNDVTESRAHERAKLNLLYNYSQEHTLL